MAITYSWKVTGLKTTTLNGTPDVVVQTYWEKIGTENGHTGKFSGATPFSVGTMPAGTTFIPFDQLTEEDVLTWIKAVVVESYEQHVNEKIQNDINRSMNPVVDASLPWSPAANTANT
jgi:hypothetical protein